MIILLRNTFRFIYCAKNKFLSTKIFACSVCYGASDSPLSWGLNMAIVTLLVILVGVLGSMTSFFLNVRKRSKLLAH